MCFPHLLCFVLQNIQFSVQCFMSQCLSFCPFPSGRLNCLFFELQFRIVSLVSSNLSCTKRYKSFTSISKRKKTLFQLIRKKTIIWLVMQLSLPVLSGVRILVVQSVVFCVMFCRSLFVFFILAFVLSVFRFKVSDYPSNCFISKRIPVPLVCFYFQQFHRRYVFLQKYNKLLQKQNKIHKKPLTCSCRFNALRLYIGQLSFLVYIVKQVEITTCRT